MRLRSVEERQKHGEAGGDGEVVNEEALVEQVLAERPVPRIDTERDGLTHEELNPEPEDAGSAAARLRVDHADARICKQDEVDDRTAESQLAVPGRPREQRLREDH